MDNAAEPAASVSVRHPLGRWVDEMQDVMKAITTLMEDNERFRAAVESSRHEHGALREEVGRLRADLERHQAEADRLRSEVERQRAAAEAALRERDEARA